MIQLQLLLAAAIPYFRQAASLRSSCNLDSGALAQAGSSIDVDGLAEAVADRVIERQQAVPDAISCRFCSVGSADMQAIQRRLNFKMSLAHVPARCRQNPASFPHFDWQPFQHEDRAALAAMQFLQDNLAPEQVTSIEIQSVQWLGFQWVKERISLRTGRTDILGAVTGEGGQELVTELLGIQQKLIGLKEQLAEVQLASMQKVDRGEAAKRQREERSRAIDCPDK